MPFEPREKNWGSVKFGPGGGSDGHNRTDLDMDNGDVEMNWIDEKRNEERSVLPDSKIARKEGLKFRARRTQSKNFTIAIW